MFENEYSVVINRPAHVVFDYVTDPAKMPEWASYIHNVQVDPPGPLGAGSRIAYTVRGGASLWEVTEYEPDVMCKYETDSSYATAQVTYRVEPQDNGTRFTIQEKGYRQGFMKWVEPLFNRMDAYYRHKQMETIKAELEKAA